MPPTIALAHAGGTTGEWAAALRERGVRRIAGDLYLAHGLFEALQIHPDWPRDQLAEWYGADKAKGIKHAEAFEVCEYGRQPGRDELKKLFPFFGLSFI